MQPPPMPDTQKVSYQVSRSILIPILFRRLILKPYRLVVLVMLIALGAACTVLRHGEVEPVLFALFIVCAILVAGYLGVVRAIDSNKQFTDPKTLEFGPSRLVVIGPDWKNEMTWAWFHGFSEDETYFYLHLTPSGLVSILPKIAFSPEQQQQFRKYAATRNA
jgi:hypothetical protein